VDYTREEAAKGAGVDVEVLDRLIDAPATFAEVGAVELKGVGGAVVLHVARRR
jgi:hypothetical protein